MIREIDDFASGKSTLQRRDVETARHLLVRLTELVGGGPSKRSGRIAKARHELACQIVASRRARVALFPNDISMSQLGTYCCNSIARLARMR